MKNIFIRLFTTLFLTTIYAQDIPKLKLTRIGVEPIVVNVDSLTAKNIYKNALNWVQETYKNPDEVLKANIENEKIRINGYSRDAWWYKSIGIILYYNIDYTIEISFKDGKYRFEYIVGQFYLKTGQRAQYGYSSFFKKSGEVRKVYISGVSSLEETMNDLSLSFYNYVTGKTKKSNDDW